MVEIAIAVAAKIAEYLVAPIARPFSYLWNYKTNLENLKSEVGKLEARRRSVELLIKFGEEPLPYVENWQERVNRTIVEASKVAEDNPEQANLQCCKGFSCPNLMKRYQLSKKAAGKLKTDVVGLEQEAAQFKEVSSRTIPEETWLQSNERYEAFESRTFILKNIIDALCNPDVFMVGIYGMGGIGKTTLVKKVARQAKQDNLFDEVVFLEVSKTPDIKNMQQEIGEKLGLEFREKTVNGRARTLYQHLKKEVTVFRRSNKKEETVSGAADNSEEKKKEKKILLILDNIWEKIDLEAVGIPLGGDCKGIKLLLTTRRRNVLTNQMDSQCNFPIDALNETDAWSLFKSIAGTFVDHPDLKSIAPEVAKECGGMPVAIVTIAKALKDKGQNEWRNALQELKNPSSKSSEGIAKEVYTSIKLSYDYLENELLQEIFLLCSHMGHTYNASIQDLFRYALSLGLFVNFDKMEDALCNAYVSVNKLKAASLLLDAPNESKESNYGILDDNGRFAMHDVVCDIARSISMGKGNVCIVIDDIIPRSWANTNKLKNCTSITLHDIGEFPKDLRLVCPQLKFFYMKTNDSFSRIPDDFFREMPVLQVLHLIEMNLSPLPTSLSHLVNLQTLCLDECKLGDIAVIGKLEKLEILSFNGSEIEKLPEEMHQLTSIRLLDLTNCSTLEIIPPNVIPCLVQLEALYMYNTSVQWEVGGLNIGRRNAGLDELKRLRDGLTTLEICIPDARMSEGLLSSQLERYKISIGFDPEWKYPPKNSRTLRFKIKTNDNADGVISQLKGIKELELFGELWDDSMHSVSCDALSSLESLVLKDLNLEKICNGPLLADSFSQLTIIRVDECNKLTNIFSFSTDRVLPQLQEIKVFSCQNMEDIFAIEREDDFNSTEVIHHEIQFSQLHSVTLVNLPRFKSFCHRVKTASPLQLTSNTEDKIDIPKSLFNDEKVVFPNLQTLKIDRINHVEKIWHNLPPTMSYCVQNLTELILSGCDNLKELFSSSTGVTEESRKEDRRDSISFPKLNRLQIGNLAKLTRLWSGYYMEFPLLKEFKISRCPALETFIFDDKVACPNLQTLYISNIHVKKIWHSLPPKISSCVQNLTQLTVYGCGNLKELFSSSTVVTEQSREEDMRDTILFPKLNCLEIENLKKLTTLCSGYYIEFPTLKEFIIGSCPQLDAFIFDDKVRVPSLEEMSIWEMDNLKMILHSNQLDGDSFSKLKSLNVYNCQKLLTLFPSNICERLLNLQELEVTECQSLKYLFAASNTVANDEYSPKFLFPKLTSLELYELPELRSFYPGRHTVEGPVLKTLKLSDCFIHDTDEEGQTQMQQPLFFVEQAFPCLEELELHGKTIMMMWQGQVPESLFVKLKILEVCSDDDSTNLPLCIIQRFQNLEKLSLYSSSYKEIFSNGEDQTQAPTPARIKTLELHCLDDLKYMWKHDFKLDLIFQNLEVLDIRRCESLINVMPPSASFQNLTVMEVERCHNLINIGTSSAAKSLDQLTQMNIVWCDDIIEVVGNHGDVTEDEIIFPKLKSLSLRYLRSLTSFCSWNVTLQFPSLEKLIVDRCPKMKIFSVGVVTTQTLREVEIDDESIELRPDVDINKAIPQFHEKVNDDSKDYNSEDYSDSSESLEMLQEDNELNKATQQLDEEVNDDSEDYNSEDYSDSSESLEMLQEDIELNKATQQLDEEANVQSSIKDCEGSSSRHLKRCATV